jgi:hypothetical protein
MGVVERVSISVTALSIKAQRKSMNQSIHDAPMGSAPIEEDGRGKKTNGQPEWRLVDQIRT